MDLVFVVCLSVCLVQLVRSGYWRVFPVFTASVVTSVAFELAYQPFSSAWLKGWYATFVTPLLVLRTLSVAEAFYKSSSGFQNRRMIAAATVFFALLFAAIVAWRFSATSPLYSAIQARRVVVVGLAAFMGVYLLLTWSLGYRRSGIVDTHALLLFLLCSVFAGASILRMAYPLGIWYMANAASYAACSLLYLTWAVVFAAPKYPPVRPLRPVSC